MTTTCEVKIRSLIAICEMSYVKTFVNSKVKVRELMDKLPVEERQPIFDAIKRILLIQEECYELMCSRLRENFPEFDPNPPMPLYVEGDNLLNIASLDELMSMDLKQAQTETAMNTLKQVMELLHD